MSEKRHKYRDGEATETFEGLSYEEQAKSINMQKINIRKYEEAHKRRAEEEGRSMPDSED